MSVEVGRINAAAAIERYRALGAHVVEGHCARAGEIERVHLLSGVNADEHGVVVGGRVETVDVRAATTDGRGDAECAAVRPREIKTEGDLAALRIQIVAAVFCIAEI